MREKKKPGEFLFPSVGRKLRSTIQVYRFYEVCQGIMNNPVQSSNPYVHLQKDVIHSDFDNNS